MKKKIKNIPLLAKIIVAIALGVLIGFVAPEWFVRSVNTFCSIFSELLRFLIPLIIIGLVTPAIANVGRGAGRMLIITVAIAYAFTVLSGLFAYSFSVNLFPSVLNRHIAEQALSVLGSVFDPYFKIAIPPFMDVTTSLVLSFILGLGIAMHEAKNLHDIFGEIETIVMNTIKNIIIPLLPIFIFGIFLDMSACGKVGPIISAFVKVIAIIFAMTMVLLLLQYSIASLVARKNPFAMLKDMMPAYFTALGTSSSAATIPVTLAQTEKIGIRKEIAGFVVPLCATIHLSGSALKITSCAIALMLMEGMPVSFPLILGFIMMLGVTMVAAPGVPGGAIMAALGVLSSILGFDSALQGMMIALYIAMDSFGTACNVTGDAAIATIINAINKKE